MKRKSRIVAIICAGLLILFVFAAFYNGLTIRKYQIDTDKIDDGVSFRIVLVSDLHSTVFGDNQKDIVSLIKKQNPDIIALAGDIVDEEMPVTGAELFLAGLQGIAPVYYVSGNHEIWGGKIESIKALVSSYGAVVLENSCERIRLGDTYITICGIDDPDVKQYRKMRYSWIREMKASFSGLHDEPGIKILLAHRPELIELYKQFGFDIVVSGHTHGGQLRIPYILNGLYAPNQGWFPRYAGGVYRHGRLTHVISRGASYNPMMPRVFNPPEVVVIDVNGSR